MSMGIGLGLSFVSGSFSPMSLSGLVWWTNAATLSASPVSSWSYGPANATQGTGAAQPTWSSSSSNVGSKPSVLYNGSQFMSAANTAALQITGDITISTVIYIVSYPAGFATILSKGTATQEFDAYVSSAGTPNFVRNSGPAAFNAGTVPTATKTIVTYTATGTTQVCYVNGTAQGTVTGAQLGASSTNAVFIGQRGDAGTTLNGEQPETVMYNRALLASELTALHRYLGAKYGITVP